jgi:hypothetical protein
MCDSPQQWFPETRRETHRQPLRLAKVLLCPVLNFVHVYREQNFQFVIFKINRFLDFYKLILFIKILHMNEMK